LGNIGKLKHDVALEKCALPQKIALYPLALQPRAGRVIDAALAIVHLRCVLPSRRQAAECTRLAETDIAPQSEVIMRSMARLDERDPVNAAHLALAR
jgi:hypothetical protein